MFQLDVYSTTNFRKKQSTIFKTILKSNRPIEVTVNDTKPNGANDGLVIIPKDEYQTLMTLKAQLVEQANASIADCA